ncbi:putative phosphodiesterase [Rhodoligotrophos appendicifer]|uniref:metallophosphoesterase family protein n=1 Tax=Rhodoligotrophos appendicifer TaxID=987056 RepID=UPI00147868FD|nr:hypothetical protein [Rhodoligotrophos appendicifer]
MNTDAPPVPDLGELDGTILLFGGVNGNLEALEALLAMAAIEAIPLTRLINTGSVAPFCVDSIACSERIAELGIPTIRGSFEEAAPRLSPESVEELDFGWQRMAAEGLPEGLKTWMDSLPDGLCFSLAGKRFRVTHGAVSRIDKLLFRSSAAPDFLEEFELAQADVVVAGRSGIPFTRGLRGKLWHNSGALGLPANDGTPRVWLSAIKATPAGISFEHRPLAYDYRTTAAKLRQISPEDDFARCLETGLWPSLEDVPQSERSIRGKPIQPPGYTLAFATESAEIR